MLMNVYISYDVKNNDVEKYLLNDRVDWFDDNETFTFKQSPCAALQPINVPHCRCARR